jgi:predicted transcriptional regulator of viral defense system
MFDQYSKSVSVINLDISKKYKFAGNEIKFIKIAEKYYFGFKKVRIEGKLVQVAILEKTLLDYLYLEKSFYSANLVFEKIKDHKKEIDFTLLINFALKFNVTVQRKLGFFLDQLDVKTDKLFLSVKKQKSFSRFTKESKKFNSKWRLYYDDRIIK